MTTTITIITTTVTTIITIIIIMDIILVTALTEGFTSPACIGQGVGAWVATGASQAGDRLLDP